MIPIFAKLDRSFGAIARPLGPILALVTRVGLGFAFLLHGWEKLQNLDRTAQFFESIGIPLASINAPFVGGVELIGGAALILGLATRPFAALLSATMIVGLITAHPEQLKAALEFQGKPHFIDIPAFSYLLLSLWVWFHGAGRISADSLVFDAEAQRGDSKR